jgi:hypothetical protein
MIAEDLRALRVERDNRCGRLRCAALSGCIHDLLLGLLGFLRRCARFSMLRSCRRRRGYRRRRTEYFVAHDHANVVPDHCPLACDLSRSRLERTQYRGHETGFRPWAAPVRLQS